MREAHKRILIAGIGNIFHGDDAFGVEVVRALESRNLPDEVQVTDFGTRSYDLAFAILDGYDAVILVDAASRERSPGSLFLLDVGPEDVASCRPCSGHAMDPHTVLSLVETMGGTNARVLVLGCEPATLECENGVGLSPPVRSAVTEAVDALERLVARLLNDQEGVRVFEGSQTSGGSTR